MERFGSWIKAMHAFCLEREKRENDNAIFHNVKNERIENKIKEKPFQREENLKEEVHNYIIMKTSRTPSLRLRFQVFRRDNFRCVKCGRSPAMIPGLELEADHIKPYSKGGETIFDNLQTLCKDCNQGKADISDFKK
jgi:5-methylcytosine-specific restriction endonuclease McrA